MSNKSRLILFLVFALLIFYQFVSHAKPVQRDPSQAKEAINEIAVSQHGNVDARIVINSESDPISPIPFLVLILNIILWIMYPKPIGRVLFSLSFLANLAIIVIIQITEASFNRAGGYQGMSIDARYLQLDQRDNLYRLFATISALVVVGMLVQVWHNRKSLRSA